MRGMGAGHAASRCYLVSDLHGNPHKYGALFQLLAEDPPDVLFIAGDLLPQPTVFNNAFGVAGEDFVNRYLVPRFVALRERLGPVFPRVLLILGNDDARFEEASIMVGAVAHAWQYVHQRRVEVAGRAVFGYACIPPSPFRRKDWERYDVSRYTDPLCISPEEGDLTVPISPRERRFTTIASDLEHLTARSDAQELQRAVFLFHVPPYDTALDTADLHGRKVDGVPLDPHVGSIAVRRLIERHAPHCTLHGHVHESYRLTGRFMERIGPTVCLSSAHDGPELVVVEFNLEEPAAAVRRVIA